MPRAAVDIGSNTILLLVLGDNGETLHDEAVVVGLGRGLGDKGMFRPDRMDAAVEVLGHFADRAAALGVPSFEVLVAATSAARRALNARSFVERVHRETGLRIQIVAGEEEARLTWRGALLDLRLPKGPIGVVDLGGGSTELVLGEGPQMGPRQSLELGSVRLTETFFGEAPQRYRPSDLARLKAHIQAELDRFTWSVLPAHWWLSRVRPPHSVQWKRASPRGTPKGCTGAASPAPHSAAGPTSSSSSAEQRRIWAAVSPERADALLAGACVLEAVCTHAHRDSLWLSIGGVRHGLLAD